MWSITWLRQLGNQTQKLVNNLPITEIWNPGICMEARNCGYGLITSPNLTCLTEIETVIIVTRCIQWGQIVNYYVYQIETTSYEWTRGFTGGWNNFSRLNFHKDPHAFTYWIWSWLRGTLLISSYGNHIHEFVSIFHRISSMIMASDTIFAQIKLTWNRLVVTKLWVLSCYAILNNEISSSRML